MSKKINSRKVLIAALGAGIGAAIGGILATLARSNMPDKSKTTEKKIKVMRKDHWKSNGIHKDRQEEVNTL
jgi:hypothetical protein